MFTRDLESKIEELAGKYPVITLLGPRQSGKTTLVKKIFPKKPYVNLENLDIRNTAEEDPRGFLNQYPEGAILDEIQRVPRLLSYIQTIVDDADRKGMFILTSSHQMELHQAVSQSLAGRTALLTLLPMSINELEEAHQNTSLDALLLKGGYPRIYKDGLHPTEAYRNYFQTYVERDLRQIINIKNLIQFERFIRICAGRIGQIFNQELIGGEVGISSATVKEWISVLEASFVIFRLQPYFENFGKRIIKSPKIYFTDVGLAAYLLGIEDVTQMSYNPSRGHLFENLIILELMKYRFNKGLDSNLYYFRDSHQHEVDLIFKTGSLLVPIEIKSGQTYNAEFLTKLHAFQHLAKDRAPQAYLIYAGELQQKIQSVHLLNYKRATRIITDSSASS
jgi:predicted AAA+ superfamily ATPase